MKRFVILGGFVLALACLPQAALADWSDNFDSYAPGSQIVGQGGWEEWSAGSGAFVSNLYSQSPSNSVAISPTTDLVHRYSGYIYGHVTYKAFQYIPSATFSGQSYYIMLNTYDPPNYEWCVQFYFDSADGLLHGNFGSSADITTPYVTDQWAEIKLEIYLNDDWVQVYYNGTLLDDPALPDHPTLGGGYKWTGGVWGGSYQALNVGAVDLFGNNANEVYYDDMALVWEQGPPTADIKVNGQDFLVMIPSGTNAKITIDIEARGSAGLPVDLWVVLKTPFGFFSYDGAGPYSGWNMGLNNAAFTGPLSDLQATVLDRIIPKGQYKAYLGIDTTADGKLTLNTIPVRDDVDFFVL